MNENSRVCLRHALRIIQVMVVGTLVRCSFGETADEPVHSTTRLFESFCSSCHSGDAPEGTFNIEKLLETPALDAKLAFEHLITRRMPPADADQPSQQERLQMASLLAKRQETGVSDSGRRISRFELNHSINDLLGTDRELAHTVPDDRGTCRYDTDQRVRLTPQQLSAYFSLAEQLLDVAFPETGFLPEYVWSTNRLKDSHHTYNIYTTPYKKGMLFSWTRANNGNSYSFFYDDFSPPVAGWYDITFDAAKVGDFKGDVTIQVHAGKYYFADDRPHPQRLLDVISVGDQKVKSYTVRGFLMPGESLSVHCFSQHTWRKENPSEGVYIEKVKVRGPLHQWPPESLTNIFPATKLQIPKRHCHEIATGKSTLEQIGGSLSVSSFEQGRGKERLLDGSNRTDWQSKTSGKPAEPPHFITIENPQRAVIEGITYSTLSGGEASRQVKSYAIYVSSDGVDWGEPIAAGDLLTRLAAEQKIIFSHPTSASWIKFLM
ncbi:MAG: discoidin domain-containing protein, partial [Planctomycetota bacterium]|nr:discoidin domain-containing protein [Planctomycetota bacterium]